MNALARLPQLLARPRWAALIAGILGLAFYFLLPPGGDIAAHLYQTEVWRERGWQFWDNLWYAGRYSQINYSLLYYPVAGILTTPVAVAGSAAVAAGAFSSLVHRRWPTLATWPAATFAFFAPLQVLSGTYPFLFSIALSMCVLVALQAGRRRLAVALGVLVALAHLLALLLLIAALAGVALITPRWWERRSIRTVAIGFAAILVASGFLWRAFTSPGGRYPFDTLDLVAVLAFCIAGIALAWGRTDMRALVAVFATYGLLAAAAFVVPSPLGSNVGRLLVYMGAPLLLVPLAARRFQPRQMAVALVGGAVLWQAYPVAIGLQAAAQVEASNEDYWYPVEAFLAENGDPNHRVNIVSTDHHWEAFFLARRGVPLTRGWYRQDDFPINTDLYANELTPAIYNTWLSRVGVKYVFLPDDRLDFSAKAEAELLRTGNVLPQVARIGGWTIYEVPNATPIATPAANIRILQIDNNQVKLQVDRAGAYRLRLRYTPYWRVLSGNACVIPRESWATELRVLTPGVVTLKFDVRIGKVVSTVLGRKSACTPDTATGPVLGPPAPDPDEAPKPPTE